MDLVLQFMGRQNTIPTPVPFIRILGDHTAAAFLAQCLYWGDRTTNPEGWFHKTHEEWHDELVLTPDQVRRCVRTCGVMVEVKRAGIPARNHYRANREEVAAALERLAVESQNATASCGETQQLETDKPHNSARTKPTARRTANPTTKSEPTSEPTQNLQKTAAADESEMTGPEEHLGGLRSGQNLKQEFTQQGGAERADAPHGADGVDALTVSGTEQGAANAEIDHATSLEKGPPGAALAALTAALAGMKKGVAALIGEYPDRQGWLELAPARIRELLAAARAANGKHYRGALIEALDEEVRRRNLPPSSRQPQDDDIDMAALMAAAPLNPIPGGRK
ncbi:hypothetical protein GCM10008949_08960 [Deinococcus humi]|nr:hypothetical protein GCM10008949_08960 [Deinococcus humi]